MVPGVCNSLDETHESTPLACSPPHSEGNAAVRSIRCPELRIGLPATASAAQMALPTLLVWNDSAYLRASLAAADETLPYVPMREPRAVRIGGVLLQLRWGAALSGAPSWTPVVRWASVMRVGGDAGFPLDGTELSCRSAVLRPRPITGGSRLGSDPLSRERVLGCPFGMLALPAVRSRVTLIAPRKPTQLSRVAALMVVPDGVVGAQGRSAAANVRVSVTGEGFASRWTSACSVRSEFLCPENHAGRGR